MLVEVLLRDAFERGELIDPGVVDQDIEPAECLLRFGKKADDLRLLRNVCLDRNGLTTLPTISATTRSAPSLLEE